MEQHLYKNTYQKEITAKITDIFEVDGKNFAIITDNIFYPQGGGQKGDRGTLKIDDKEYKVLTTVKHLENMALALLVTEELLPADLKNKEVLAVLDWEFRFKQMRLHSALHLYHHLLEQVLGGKLTYPNLSMIENDGTAVLRYDNPNITEEIIAQANDKFNKIINESIDITTYPDKEKEGFRYWQFNDYAIPCGGTHVKNTKEIGKVSTIFSTKKSRQTVKFKLED
ncbi:MAG: alanyl-tRNA editing protein [Pseudomonadales bacterium]|nr:alanyl-tRNA editing protein [Pseudomonadales bacterium]